MRYASGAFSRALSLGVVKRVVSGARLVIVAALVSFIIPRLVSAQSASEFRREIVYGIVRDSSGSTIRTSDVLVTVGRTFQVLRTATDSLGRFRVVVDSGGGDYLVAVIATGFHVWRQRVSVSAVSDSVGLQVTLLSASPSALALFKVKASRPQPRDINTSVGARGGSSEQVISEGGGVVAPGDAGDLTLSATLNPALFASGEGVGALGLGADQSRVTINGLPAGSAGLPRDMRRRMRAGTTNYDPAVGGFSAAAVTVDLLRGGTITMPRLRLSCDGDLDALGANSARSGMGQRMVLSYATSGEAVPERFAYNVGVSATKRERRTESLGTTETRALRAAGISQNMLDVLTGGVSSLRVPFESSSRTGLSTEVVDAAALGLDERTIGASHPDRWRRLLQG